MALALPPRRDDVDDWKPPAARPVAAEMHAIGLIAMFQAEGKTGVWPHWRIVRRYPEFCWDRGYHELSEREILQALGQVCAKVRATMDRGDGIVSRVTCYVIPAPHFAGKSDNSQHSEPGNVVSIVTKRSKIPSGSRLSASKSERKVARAKAQRRKGGAHRADIREAVACNI